MNKVILIDSGFFCHKAIFAWSAEKKRRLLKGDEDEPLMSTYTYLNMIYGTLKKIGIDRDDIIIVACDARNSWRKGFLTEYKGNRKGLRDSTTLVDWGMHYGMINKLEKQLDESTNWHFIKLEKQFNFADLVLSEEGERLNIEDYDIDLSTEFGIESDDIQSVACRYFPDKEVILVTIDEDLSQLCYYDNVKIFNPNLKSPTNKAKKGFYTIVNDPLKIKQDKIRKGDKSDNILVNKFKDTELDVEIRKVIIDLLMLPQWIEKRITSSLDDIDYTKQIDYDSLPFKNSLGKRFDTIYESKNVVTWEQSVKTHEGRKEKKLAQARKSRKKKKEKVKV